MTHEIPANAPRMGNGDVLHIKITPAWAKEKGQLQQTTRSATETTDVLLHPENIIFPDDLFEDEIPPMAMDQTPFTVSDLSAKEGSRRGLEHISVDTTPTTDNLHP